MASTTRLESDWTSGLVKTQATRTRLPIGCMRTASTTMRLSNVGLHIFDTKLVHFLWPINLFLMQLYLMVK